MQEFSELGVCAPLKSFGGYQGFEILEFKGLRIFMFYMLRVSKVLGPSNRAAKKFEASNRNNKRSIRPQRF